MNRYSINELKQQNDELKAYVNEAKGLVDLTLRGSKRLSELEPVFARFDARTPEQSLTEVKAQVIKDMCDTVAGYSGQFGETVLRLEDIRYYADTLLTHGDNNE